LGCTMDCLHQNRLRNQADLHAARHRALAAHLDSQPANTKKTYARPIREWEVRGPAVVIHTPAQNLADPGAQNFCAARRFDDGILVTQDKVCLWLEEVVFKIRRPPTKAELKASQKKRVSVPPPTGVEIEPADIEWGRERGLTEGDLRAMLMEDRVDLERDSVEEPESAEPEGALLKAETIYNAYLSAISNLHDHQHASQQGVDSKFRGVLIKNMISSRRSAQDQRNREAFEDRGANGIQSGYSAKDWHAIQVQLLRNCAGRPSVSVIQGRGPLAGGMMLTYDNHFRACVAA